MRNDHHKAPTIESLQFSGAGHPVLCVDAAPVAAHVRKVLANWPGRAVDQEAFPISVVGHGGHFSISSPFLKSPLQGLSDVGAACGAIVDTAQSFLDANPGHLCLHCTSFEIDGRLVVLTGSAHAGKSTLAARMTAEPVLVYCDDMLPLTAPDNLGLALGIPPRPRLPLPRNAGETMVEHIRMHTAASDGKYCYLDTHNLAPHGRTAPIGALVLLDRRADGPAGFASADRAEALRHLLLRNMVRNTPASELTDRLDTLLEAVPCVKLFYSRLDDAALLLTNTFVQWPVDGSALLNEQPQPGTPLAQKRKQPSRTTKHRVAADRPYRRADGIVAKSVGGETFLFDAADCAVLNLNPLAGAIWRLLAKPVCVQEAASLLAEAFSETPYDIVLADTEALFSDLEHNGLIKSVVSEAKTQEVESL